MPRRGRLLILGLPYFGRMLADSLGGEGWDARYAPHPGRSPAGWLQLAPQVARAGVIYVIGGQLGKGSPHDLVMRIRRKPVVMHWVGTDVQRALLAHDRGDISARLAENAIHWCDAPWLVDELRSIGVRSEHVPLPIPGLAGPPPPLPERFRVLLYLPAEAPYRRVFDVETLLRLPGEFPGIEFIEVPSPPDAIPGPLPPNLKALAWVEDMDALYREVAVYIRATLHDGMSFMAVEALARGRHVIWSYPLPGAIHASGFDAVAAALRDLAARHAAGTLELNTEGRSYVLEHFDPERLTHELDQRLAALVSGQSS